MPWFCASEDPGGRLPSKKDQALPWWLVSVPRSTRKANYHLKSTKHYRGGLFLCQGVPGRPVTIQKRSRITVMVCFFTKEYQEGQLPSENYRELSWCPVSAPRSTCNAGYNPQKIPSITVMACFCAKKYQEGRLPSKKYQALPWWFVSVPRSTRKASYHTKIPSITMMACFCVHEYQEGQLPSKKN